MPKSYQTDKWRLIVDLSHPKEGSVNDEIPKQLCSMKYISMDDTINKVLQQGQNS